MVSCCESSSLVMLFQPPDRRVRVRCEFTRGDFRVLKPSVLLVMIVCGLQMT